MKHVKQDKKIQGITRRVMLDTYPINEGIMALDGGIRPVYRAKVAMTTQSFKWRRRWLNRPQPAANSAEDRVRGPFRNIGLHRYFGENGYYSVAALSILVEVGKDFAIRRQHPCRQS